MQKRKPEGILEEILFGIAALSLLIGILALGFSHYLSKASRAQIVLVSILVLIASFCGLVFLEGYRKRQRIRSWHRTMRAWKESVREGKIPDYGMARNLSSGALIELAIQVYSSMGYSILSTHEERDQEAWIRLVNPEGGIELVHCKQWPEPVGYAQIRKLQIAMNREEALRGFLWAPGGFSMAAIYWIKNKPIILVDNREIGRLVDCVLGDGLRPLES